MLTAKACFDNRIEGLSLGADDYLTKPFHVRELQLRVHNLLERQRLLREKLRLEISQPDPTGIHSDAKPQPADLTDAFIKKLYDIIEDKLDDSLFGVQELANSIGMSRATLHRKLKAITDMSAGDIIRNYRLKRAASFLKLGHNSSETAYLVGFDSPAYFSKCFKDFYKLSPLEYIQKGQ
jgi:AraC-like DNA-binding protein